VEGERMTVIAHAGHWLVQVAYFAPVVLFLVWLGWMVIRDRRSGDGESPT
jgi:membrane protein implicated in regulation of membrane protease activity